jgi:hypothetical protein
MAEMFFRAIEIAFASYMVPALLLPAAWLAAVLLRKRVAHQEPAREIRRQSRLLWGFVVVWLALFAAALVGVPLNRGGPWAVAFCWMVYAANNLLLAWFLLRVTTRYALIPAGLAADAAFGRFLSIVLAQPLVTAVAFAVLNQVMGVAWNLQVPALPAIQEGI